MARVANCPQCQHELFIPDGTDDEAWAKCPECRAFFQTKQAESREVATALMVESGEATTNVPSAGENDDAMPASWKNVLGDEPIAGESDELELESSTEPTASGDKLEAAAQRIDEWFRSAKTLPDTPPAPAEVEPLRVSDLGEVPETDESETSPNQPHIGATIDFSADDLDDVEISQDFDLGEEIEDKSEAAWDDTNQMDELLADIDVPESDKPADEMQSFDMTAGEERPEFAASTASTDSPEVVATSGNKRRRKRSPVRTLIMIVFAGIVGLALGYYALLWLRGPSMDFLNVAQYVPPSLLPSSFNSQQPTRTVLNTAPQNPAPPEAAVETPAEEATEPETLATDAAPPEAIAADEQPTATEPVTVEAVPVTEPESPAEIQAGFTTEEPPTEKAASSEPATDGTGLGDRYADTLASTDTPPAEPAELAEEPAAELITDTEVVEPVRIAGAPSFTSNDLSAALDTAKNAQSSLIEGNFTDSKEVARAKGLSYAALADLAQKATFVDAAAQPAEAPPLQQATDDLFRQTLAEPRIRNEVAVILMKWIASPNRKHGGAFFAGNVARQEQAGSVMESRVEPENGESITVLTPSTTAEATTDATRPQAVIGYIIDQPADKIEGYTGTAKQAIWTNRLVPLE